MMFPKISPACSSRTKWRILALNHGVNDLQAQHLEAFAPLLVEHLGITIGQAGTLVSMGGLMHACLQPLAGFISDQKGHNRFILWGVVMAAFFGNLIPLVPSLPLALCCVVLWGVGTAIFHPQGQGAAGYVADPPDLPMAIALFSLGGMLGTAIGPVYGIFLYNHLGWLAPLAALILPLLSIWLCARTMPRIHPGRQDSQGLAALPKRFVAVFRKVWPVWAVTFSRDCSRRGLQFLLPLLVSFRGGSLAWVGTVLLILSFLSALSPLLAARFRQSVSTARIVVFSIPAAAALILLGLALPLIWAVPMMVAGGVVASSSISLTEALAQSLAPHDRSTVSSLTMGFSYGLAGLLLTPFGFLADYAGIERALALIACLPPLIVLPVVGFVWRRRGLLGR